MSYFRFLEYLGGSTALKGTRSAGRRRPRLSHSREKGKTTQTICVSWMALLGRLPFLIASRTRPRPGVAQPIFHHINGEPRGSARRFQQVQDLLLLLWSLKAHGDDVHHVRSHDQGQCEWIAENDATKDLGMLDNFALGENTRASARPHLPPLSDFTLPWNRDTEPRCRPRVGRWYFRSTSDSCQYMRAIADGGEELLAATPNASRCDGSSYCASHNPAKSAGRLVLLHSRGLARGMV